MTGSAIRHSASHSPGRISFNVRTQSGVWREVLPGWKDGASQRALEGLS